MRRKYVSQAEVNHKKYGSKWNLAKAKKFFKAILGTDKFVEETPHGIGYLYVFRNDYVWFEAYVGYGSNLIELKSVNPYKTIGYYDFVTFAKDHDYSSKQHDRHWEDIKKEIIYSHNDWLHTLSTSNVKRFEEEIQKIKDYNF